MTNAELINELNVLFGKNRAKLHNKLKAAIENIPFLDNIGYQIHSKTNQPIRGSELLSKDILEGIKNPDFEIEEIGDCCFYYEIVLNSGIKDGMDWDIKLADKCKGGVKICNIWSSLLFPYYTIDYYLMKYKQEYGEVEITPYKPSTKRELQIDTKIKDIFKSNSIKPVSAKLAKSIVPKAITDVKPKGEATVFDCLFSDIQSYTDYKSRFSYGHNDQNKLNHIYPNTEISWKERIDTKNRVLERNFTISCQSGETIYIELDEKYQISKIILPDTHNNMTLDVKKKKLVNKIY